MEKIRLNEEPSAFIEKVMRQLMSYLFLPPCASVWLFDGIHAVQMTIDVDHILNSVPELLNQAVDATGNKELGEKLIANIKFNITPFVLNKDGISFQAILISSLFENIVSSGTRDVIKTLVIKHAMTAPEANVKLSAITSSSHVINTLNMITHAPSAAAAAAIVNLFPITSHPEANEVYQVNLTGNMTRERVEEMLRANPSGSVDPSEDVTIVMKVNLEVLSTILEIKEPLLGSHLRNSAQYVLKIFNSNAVGEFDPTEYMTCYNNELECYNRFSAKPLEHFNFAKLLFTGDISILGLGTVDFINGKYLLMERITDNFDVESASPHLKEEVIEKCIEQVTLQTNYGIHHEDLERENIIVNVTDSEVTVTLIDYEYPKFMQEYDNSESYLDGARWRIECEFK